jgi:hypothetical protein
MRIFMAGAVTWMLSACNKSYEVYGVDGVSDTAAALWAKNCF